jgi:hypothetical protein
VDLERPSDFAVVAGDLEGFLGAVAGSVAIDEAQRLPALFPALRYAIDHSPKKGRFLLLGSASPMLMRSAGETLAGRVAVLELTPFLASFEGLVVEELAALASRQLAGPELFFWRTQAGAEVDLLIVEGQRILPVEIKLGTAVDHYALAGLRQCMADLELTRGWVVTTSEERRRLASGIEVVPCDRARCRVRLSICRSECSRLKPGVPLHGDRSLAGRFRKPVGWTLGLSGRPKTR